MAYNKIIYADLSKKVRFVVSLSRIQERDEFKISSVWSLRESPI